MKGGGPSEGLEARATKVRACPQQHCTLGLHPQALCQAAADSFLATVCTLLHASLVRTLLPPGEGI